MGKRNSLVSMFIPFDYDISTLRNYLIDNFFSNHVVYSITEIQLALKKLYQLLKEEYKDAKLFHLFGELFGGLYDVSDKNFKPI